MEYEAVINGMKARNEAIRTGRLVPARVGAPLSIIVKDDNGNWVRRANIVG